MSGIRELLRNEPKPVTIMGEAMLLRRPSALDLIEALDIAAREPSRVRVWLVATHALDAAGERLFESMDAALAAPAGIVNAIADEAEKLYGEGRD